MQEFIKKLIERLEKILVENTCSDCPYKAKCDEVQERITDETTDLCGATIKALSIEIANQLAEEYKNNSSETLPTPYQPSNPEISNYWKEQTMSRFERVE